MSYWWLFKYVAVEFIKWLELTPLLTGMVNTANVQPNPYDYMLCVGYRTKASYQVVGFERQNGTYYYVRDYDGKLGRFGMNQKVRTAHNMNELSFSIECFNVDKAHYKDTRVLALKDWGLPVIECGLMRSYSHRREARNLFGIVLKRDWYNVSVGMGWSGDWQVDVWIERAFKIKCVELKPRFEYHKFRDEVALVDGKLVVELPLHKIIGH